MAAAELIFEKQRWHLAALAALLAAVLGAAHALFLDAALLGIPARAWLTLALAAAVAHQTWVWLCWRLELHTGWLTRTFGEAGFRLYAVGFAFFAALRVGSVVCLAIADRGSLARYSTMLFALGIALIPPVAFLHYSVVRYFTFRRALGADHFDPSYRSKPLETRGIFHYTKNGMYTFGLLIIWLPGLFAASKAALLAAAFNHAYVWVHYFFTERPDMRRIYGKRAAAS